MKTKTTNIYCMLTAFLLIAFNANAQNADKKFSFGFGVAGGLITGDFKDVYNEAAGITVLGPVK